MSRLEQRHLVYTPEDRTLPEPFGEAGYETCLVGKMHFRGTRQFNGFDHRPYGDLTGHGIQQPGHQPDPISPERLERQPRRQAIDRGTRIPNAGVTEIPESLLQERDGARETITWLRELVNETVDFEEIEAERRRTLETAKTYELGIPPGTGNGYPFPDGRLVDARTVLYKPDVLADDPALIFDDWPGADADADDER